MFQRSGKVEPWTAHFLGAQAFSKGISFIFWATSSTITRDALRGRSPSASSSPPTPSKRGCPRSAPSASIGIVSPKRPQEPAQGETQGAAQEGGGVRGFRKRENFRTIILATTVLYGLVGGDRRISSLHPFVVLGLCSCVYSRFLSMTMSGD